MSQQQKETRVRRLQYNGTALLLGFVGAALAAACAAPASHTTPAAPPAPAHSLRFSRMVDLSHTITQDMPHLPGKPATRFEVGDGDDPEYTGAVHMSTRSGTHMRLVSDAAPRRLLVEHLAPRDLVVPAVVLDVRNQAQDTPTYRLDVAAIGAWEARHGTIPPDCIVLLATGWDTRWGSAADYLNLDNEQVSVVPGFGRAALALLLHERGVYGVGIDTPTLSGEEQQAAGSTAPAAAGTARARALWLALENLTRLEQLPPTGTTLVIGALAVQNSTTAPARVLAFIP